MNYIETVHDGEFVIFYFSGKYYKCSQETYTKILLKDLKIQEFIEKGKGKE